MTSFKNTLIEALHAAGDIIRNSLCDTKKVEYKGAVDLVTPTDREAEKVILEIIQKAFPEHAILAEESGIRGQVSTPHHVGCGASIPQHMKQRPDPSVYRWIIDPLDGTTNFAHGLPHVGTSIALSREGNIILGGVLDPFRNECFIAERGKGAFVNKARIRVSETKTLDRSLLTTGFPYDRITKADKYMEMYKNFMVRAQGIRRIGSAALDLCYVACGRFDGFWELKLHPWDTAAGLIIVKEAGGIVTDFENRPFDPFGPQILAANKFIHPKMLKVLEPFKKLG